MLSCLPFFRLPLALDPSPSPFPFPFLRATVSDGDFFGDEAAPSPVPAPTPPTPTPVGDIPSYLITSPTPVMTIPDDPSKCSGGLPNFRYAASTGKVSKGRLCELLYYRITID